MKATVKSSFRFDTNRIVSDLTERAFDNAEEKAREKLRFLKCPVHGKMATIKMEGFGNSRNLTISGCCEDFRKKALAIISK